MGFSMTNLTDREREAVVDHFFHSETAFLIELIFKYVPEDLLKEMGVSLTMDDDVAED
jgi:hypothetical protein